MSDYILDLFKKGKILVRGMDDPVLTRNQESRGFSYDFSTWATEYEIAKTEGLTSLSTTLLVPEEAIPTYKSIGFIINSDNVDVRHICETDSISSGNEKNGDFSAAPTNVKTLTELKEIIKTKHNDEMNEVNINMRENAYIGLFMSFSGVANKRLIARTLLAQKYYELQTGEVLPIFHYDFKSGCLEKFDMTLDEKISAIQQYIADKLLRTSSVSYESELGDEKCVDYLEELQKAKSQEEKRKLTLQTISSLAKQKSVAMENENCTEIFDKIHEQQEEITNPILE